MTDQDPSQAEGTPPGPEATHTHFGSAAAPTRSPTALPAFVGRYRILGKLGEGGMGVVYEAEQQNPNRRIAGKVVRGGRTVTETQVRLFQREVDTLARLDHPDIGAIYESGCTDEGLHYFAMELIRGKPLDEYIRDRPQPVGADELRFRLALFRRIADAVHYAHQRGVIHRDLKPSNIIVTERRETSHDSGMSIGGLSGIVGMPGIKILDFGLARITEGDLATATMATEIGVIKGTLAYMSPEQALGIPDAIDMRSDVYALGVILFEMLSGTRPYEVSDRSLAEAVRVIGEQRPRSLRQASAGLVRFDADVETIVAKALEKEVGRRYGSAAELSGDVVRYLSSQPILARPPSTAYLLKKLIARNRVASAFAGVLLLALVAFGVGMTFLFARATRAERQAAQQAETATRALGFMTDMFKVSDPSEALGSVVTAREVLDRGAVRIRGELRDQPEIQSALMTSMGEVYYGLGLPESARPLLEEAVARRRERLGDTDERTLRSVAALAGVDGLRGHYADGIALLEKGLAPFHQPAGTEPEAVLSARTTLAELYRKQGRLDDAERLGLATLETQRKRLGPNHEDSLLTADNLVNTYTDKGKFDEAAKLAQEVVALDVAKFGADHPQTYTAKNNLSTVYGEQGRFDDELKILQETVASAERVAGPEHPDTLETKSNLAFALRNAGRYDESIALYDKIIEIQSRTLGERHPSTLNSMNNKVAVLLDQEKPTEAKPLAEQVLAAYTQAFGLEHPSTLRIASNLAMIYFHMGDYDEAGRRLHALYETRVRVMGKDHPETASDLENYANVLFRLNRLDEVPKILNEVLDTRTRVLGENHTATSRTRTNLATVLGSQGKSDEAVEILKHELAIQTALGPDSVGVAEVKFSLAKSLARLKKHDEALQNLNDVLRIRRRLFGERSPQVAATLQKVAASSMELGKHAEAEAAIGEAIAIQREKAGADDPDTLMYRYWQARIVGAAGRTEEAIRLAADCYEAGVRAKVTRYPIASESAKLAAEFEDKLGSGAAAAAWRKKQAPPKTSS